MMMNSGTRNHLKTSTVTLLSHQQYVWYATAYESHSLSMQCEKFAHIMPNSWLTQNIVLSVKSFGCFASGSHSNTCRFTFGNAIRLCHIDSTTELWH